MADGLGPTGEDGSALAGTALAGALGLGLGIGVGDGSVLGTGGLGATLGSALGLADG
ncbi:MAG: hypothetical protein H0U58_04205 [Chloroflexi bacterium]|nr:hypothetical protein [Chloroflexota bacterium]